MKGLELVGDSGINENFIGITKITRGKSLKVRNLGGKPIGCPMAAGQLPLAVGKLAWRLQNSLKVMMDRLGVAIGRARRRSDRI